MSSLSSQQPDAPDTPPVTNVPRKKKGVKRESDAGKPEIEWEETTSSKKKKKQKKDDAEGASHVKKTKKPTKTGLNRAICKGAKTFRTDVDRLFPNGRIPPPPTVKEDGSNDAHTWLSIVDWWNESRLFVAAVLGMLASDLPAKSLILDKEDPRLSGEPGVRGPYNTGVMRFIHAHVLVALTKAEYWDH